MLSINMCWLILPAQMVHAALKESSLSTIPWHGKVFSDSAMAFKPSPTIYNRLVDYVNKGPQVNNCVPVSPEHIWLVSG